MSESCLDDALLADVAEGRRVMTAAVESHLARCSGCRRTFAAVARGQGSTVRDAAPPMEDDEPGWDEIGQGVVVGGRYWVESFIGAGAMGVVWRARHVESGAVVALKIARGGDLELSRRFEREAQVLGALRHPCIVRVFETLPGTETRGPVIVQELLRGESLELRLARERTLPLAEACRTIVAIASALRSAHASGVVHRDLKPSNVFATIDRRVVVLDFGIAKLLPAWGANTKLTRTGAVVGSPRYMAPEQVFGDPADARADVWAVGALLFRALAGRAPFETDNVGEIMRGLQRGQIPDLAMLAPAVPADILALTRAALTIDRARRLSEVASFEAVLSRYA